MDQQEEASVEPTAEEKIEMERKEEEKLKLKYPGVGRGLPGKPAGGPGGQSAFLQKRMAKNAKYFDSGDYQMEQQKDKGKGRGLLAGLKLGGGGTGQAGPTGSVIPTPELVPARKTSIIQPRADHSAFHGLGGESPTSSLPPNPLASPSSHLAI